jgi:hypothetical protein
MAKKAPLYTMNPKNAGALGYPTKKGMNKIIRGIVGSEYNPLMRELKANRRASDYRINKELPAWYQSYRSQVDQMAGKTAQDYADLQKNLAGLEAATSAREDATRSDMASRLAADAAARGSNANPAKFDAAGAGAAAARAGSTAAIMANLGGRAAIRGDYLGDRSMNVGLEQNAAIGNEKLRRQKIGQEIAQTRKDRANRRLEVIQSLLEGGNQFYLDRAALAENRRQADLDYSASMADGGSSGGGGSSSGASADPPGRDDWGVALRRLEKNFPYWRVLAPGDSENAMEVSKNQLITFVTGPGQDWSMPAAKKAVARWYEILKRKEAERERRNS